ncbi:hypothetical protein IW150_006933, partial [Coemansia sp. RSA 2607]
LLYSSGVKLNRCYYHYDSANYGDGYYNRANHHNYYSTFSHYKYDYRAHYIYAYRAHYDNHHSAYDHNNN